MNGYALLDFGNGRKLERFGGVLVDRPCRVAGLAARVPSGHWAAQASFVEWESNRLLGPDARARLPARAAPRAGSAMTSPLASRRGHWECSAALPEDWHVHCGGVRLGLRLTSSGQVGIFPEHAVYWPWIQQQIQQAGPGVRVLNLFAYTGGATLAAAAAGAEVVHVDAAPSAVEWARQNAQQGGLAHAPIRWIVDDCRAFVAREVRRKRTYHGLVLDPPTYGHGRRGQAWRLAAHLAGLLSQCRQLLVRSPLFVLCTCHTPGFGPARLARLLQQSLALNRTCYERMQLVASDGRTLSCGAAARWAASTTW